MARAAQQPEGGPLMPGVAVGIVLMTLQDDALKTLALRHGRGWQLPYGGLGRSEPLRRAAERIIDEQVGIQVDYLEQLYTFGNIIPKHGERLLEICYYGLVPSGMVLLEATTGKQQRRWLGAAEWRSLPPLQERIVQRAQQRLRGKLAYTAVGFELLPQEFTLAELQQLYETILGKRLDKRNFRKRLAELQIVAATGTERIGPRGRPAALYSFKAEVFERLDSRGDILAF